MRDTLYSSSQETQILSATPVELTKMLFDGAVQSTVEARRHLAQGRIPERARAVSKAVEIIGELAHSLDHKAGGELSARLAALYDYLQRILLDANYRQADDGLAEAERLLRIVQQAWSQISATESRSVPPLAAEAAVHEWSA